MSLCLSSALYDFSVWLQSPRHKEIRNTMNLFFLNEALWNWSIWFVCMLFFFIPTAHCPSLLLLHLWDCSLYYLFPSKVDVTQIQICNYTEMHNKNPNQWRLCKDFHYWTLGWLHAWAMSGVMMGVLPLRWRNPHWFLIGTCQVSIKKVPSPPLVSIEIRLTNKK